MRSSGVVPLRHVDDGGEGGDVGMYGWVFPVLVPDPARMSRMLLRMGFDAPAEA